MALQNSDSTLSLEQILYQRPYEFEFVQAVHLLQILNPLKTSLGQGYHPEKEAVHLKARVFLSAPPSDLFRIQQSAEEAFEEKAPEIHVNFLGIAGIQGPLPLPYTEVLLERLRQKDGVFRDFLDIFNHRFLSLFYRIQQKFSPALNLKLPHETPQGRNLQAFVGWLDELSPFFLRHMLFYASFFWQKPRNPEGLRAILQHLFHVSIEISLFQGSWMSIAPEDRTYLGKNTLEGRLGQGAVLGKRAWCQAHGILIHFRFEDFNGFKQFLPTGEMFFKVQKMISCYLGPSISFKIALEPLQKPASWLTKNKPFFLGWTSWLGRRKKPQLPPERALDRQVVLSA